MKLWGLRQVLLKPGFLKSGRFWRPLFRRLSFRQGPWKRGRIERWLHGAAWSVALVFIAAALFAWWIAPYDPLVGAPQQALSPPSWGHPLGQDTLGRDVYSRIVHGARVSLFVAALSTAWGGTCGLLLGLLAALRGGWIDTALCHALDTLESLPLFVVALVLGGGWGPSLWVTSTALALPLIPRAARVVRAEARSVLAKPFVEAARAQGSSSWNLTRWHVLPNALNSFLVVCGMYPGTVILSESSLSFLGLGVPEPYPSWGRMLGDSVLEYAQRAPWLLWAPGVTISLAVAAANLLGDALRDALDPRDNAA